MSEFHNRRSFLQLALSAGAAWAVADLSQVEEALAWAAQPHAPGAAARELTVLSALDATVVDAMTSRILPATDGRPGAHEAGVVYFIDRALATFNASQKQLYADGIKELNAAGGAQAERRDQFRHADDGAAGRSAPRDRADAVFSGGPVRHHGRHLRAADLGRQSRLHRLAACSG